MKKTNNLKGESMITKKVNKLIRVISKRFQIDRDFLFLSLKYDSRFYSIIEVACDFNVDALKVCKHLKQNAEAFKLNFNN